MIAVQKISTYPLHSEEHPRSTMFPASRMPLLTQFQLHHPVPENCASNLYTEDWQTAPLMMMTPQKMMFLSLVVHHKYSTMQVIHDHYLPVHPSCFYSPGRRRRWRRRGLPNCFTGWWTLDYWWNSWQTIMYTSTFITTWTMPLPMSIFGLPNLLLFWNHGFKWHLWIQRPDDHFQW